jgi:hypothetical protein
LPLSVAQHSLTVLQLRRLWSPTPLDPLRSLRELLHDAEEGLLGFDCISVLKPFLGDSFRELSQRLEQAVFLRYGLPAWTRRNTRSTSGPTACRLERRGSPAHLEDYVRAPA